MFVDCSDSFCMSMLAKRLMELSCTTMFDCDSICKIEESGTAGTERGNYPHMSVVRNTISKEVLIKEYNFERSVSNLPYF